MAFFEHLFLSYSFFPYMGSTGSISKELLLMTISKSLSFSSVQLLSRVQFFAT